MRAHGKRVVKFPVTQNFHQALAFSQAHKALFSEFGGRHVRTGFKAREMSQIDNRVILAERQIAVAKSTQEWQTF